VFLFLPYYLGCVSQIFVQSKFLLFKIPFLKSVRVERVYWLKGIPYTAFFSAFKLGVQFPRIFFSLLESRFSKLRIVSKKKLPSKYGLKMYRSCGVEIEIFDLLFIVKAFLIILFLLFLEALKLSWSRVDMFRLLELTDFIVFFQERGEWIKAIQSLKSVSWAKSFFKKKKRQRKFVHQFGWLGPSSFAICSFPSLTFANEGSSPPRTFLCVAPPNFKIVEWF